MEKHLYSMFKLLFTLCKGGTDFQEFISHTRNSFGRIYDFVKEKNSITLNFLSDDNTHLRRWNIF